MNDFTLPLSGLSPVSGKTVVAKFDGGLLSSDGGVLLLREIELRMHVAERLAGYIRDPRDPGLVTHTLADIIRFRLLMIGAGYEDGNDASALRSDPIFKMAQGVAPNLMHEGDGQSASPVPARRRLLDHVGLAHGGAQALGLAQGSVRHSASAPREDRRARRRDEDRHQNPSADELSRSAILPHRALAHSAPRDMTGGRAPPKSEPFSVHPQAFAARNSGPPPEPLALRARHLEPEKCSTSPREPVKRCIIADRT